MSPAIYIQVNLVSALLCILLYYEQKKHHAFGFLGTTTFNALLWCTVFILVVDAFSWLMVADSFPHNDMFLMITRCVYYFLQALLPLLFMDYIIKSCEVHPHPILKAIRILPMLYTVVILVLNFNRHFAFRVVNNEFFRAEGFLYSILGPFIYMIVSLIFSAVFFLRSRAERNHIAFHMFTCVLISFVGAISSSFIPGTAPWHIFVFSLIYFYMRLHGIQERDLDFLAYSDSLTGLKNYAAYSHLKHQLIQKLDADPKHHFAVAVLDINDLKKTNDIYGHKAGNELILSSSRLICDVFRHSPVCRIGGDEFVTILENSDYEHREALLEQFSQRLASATFPVGIQDIPFTVAIGLMEYQPGQHTSYDDVFHAADEAMYRNKALLKETH